MTFSNSLPKHLDIKSDPFFNKTAALRSLAASNAYTPYTNAGQKDKQNLRNQTVTQASVLSTAGVSHGPVEINTEQNAVHIQFPVPSIPKNPSPTDVQTLKKQYEGIVHAAQVPGPTSSSMQTAASLAKNKLSQLPLDKKIFS